MVTIIGFIKENDYCITECQRKTFDLRIEAEKWAESKCMAKQFDFYQIKVD